MDIFKLSEVKPLFKGRIAKIEYSGGDKYRFYNMGFYPGNRIIVLYVDKDFIIMYLGRHVVRVDMDIAKYILVFEDPSIPLVE